MWAPATSCSLHADRLPETFDGVTRRSVVVIGSCPALDLVAPVVSILRLDPTALPRDVTTGATLGDDSFEFVFADCLPECFAVVERLGRSPMRTVQVQVVEDRAALRIRQPFRFLPSR